jgi:hypothetical protein
MEQVRSMITVKQKQKALIEQRRGSVAGLMSPVANTPPTPVEDRNISSKIPPPPPAPSSNNCTSHRSPNTGTGVRRLNNNSQPQRVTKPSRPQSSQPSQQQTPPTHSLPPPPISLARCRAAQLGVFFKKKVYRYPNQPNLKRSPYHLSIAPAPLRSPTVPSVPIASTLVPPTPKHSLDRRERVWTRMSVYNSVCILYLYLLSLNHQTYYLSDVLTCCFRVDLMMSFRRGAQASRNLRPVLQIH